MKHNSVFAAVRDAAFKHKLLSVGTVALRGGFGAGLAAAAAGAGADHR